MIKVNEYSREQFTDEEVEIARFVSDAVCKVFKITDAELRSSSRKKPIPDARKIFSHYICHNIRLDKIKGNYNVALPTWYLHQNHSTVCYAVEQAETLYDVDHTFRSLYDNVVGVINNPEGYNISIKKMSDKFSRDRIVIWEDVRLSGGYTYEKKKSLMPKKISDRVKEMYEIGYSIPQIAYHCKMGESFARKYVEEMGFVRAEINTNLICKKKESFRAPARRYSTTIDY